MDRDPRVEPRRGDVLKDAWGRYVIDKVGKRNMLLAYEDGSGVQVTPSEIADDDVLTGPEADAVRQKVANLIRGEGE